MDVVRIEQADQKDDGQQGECEAVWFGYFGAYPMRADLQTMGCAFDEGAAGKEKVEVNVIPIINGVLPECERVHDQDKECDLPERLLQEPAELGFVVFHFVFTSIDQGPVAFTCIRTVSLFPILDPVYGAISLNIVS